MKLKVLNSNSQGNCYLMQAENGETLILDCGLSFGRIKKALDFNLKNVSGVLITHSHSDHSKGVKEGLKQGFPFFMSEETAIEIDFLWHHNIKVCKPKQHFTVGSFQVMPFDVEHDVRCFGYLIAHEESGNTVFITDTYYVPYTFPSLTNIIVEANYCQKIVDEKLLQDKKFLRDRVIRSHMEIQTTKGFLLANDLSGVNKIILIHLSDSNSNAADFKAQVERVTQKSVFIAEPDSIYSINKNPF